MRANTGAVEWRGFDRYNRANERHAGIDEVLLLSPGGDSMVATGDTGVVSDVRGGAVSVPSRGFDGCNLEGGGRSLRPPVRRFSPLAGIRWLQPRPLSRSPTKSSTICFSPLAGIRWLQRGEHAPLLGAQGSHRFQSPRGDSMVATAPRPRLAGGAGTTGFQSPRGDSMVATPGTAPAPRRRARSRVSVPSRGFDGCNLLSASSAIGTKPCFSPLAGIRWLQPSRCRARAAFRTSRVSVPSRGFDGCNSAPPSRTAGRKSRWFQSPRGDSMVATSGRGLRRPDPRVGVSVPSRGFDGCNG